MRPLDRLRRLVKDFAIANRRPSASAGGAPHRDRAELVAAWIPRCGIARDAAFAKDDVLLALRLFATKQVLLCIPRCGKMTSNRYCDICNRANVLSVVVQEIMTLEATVENIAPAKMVKRIVSCREFRSARNRGSDSKRVAPKLQVFEREFELKPSVRR
jgi:hypothetical protein